MLLLLNKKYSHTSLVATSLLFTYGCVVLLFNNLLNNNVTLHLPRLLGWLLFIFIASSKLEKSKWGGAIRTVWYTHIGFFMIQLIAWYLGDIKLDLVGIISDGNSRIGANKLGGELSNSFIRPAGLFSEPGTFALFNFTCSILLFVIYGSRINLIFAFLINLSTLSMTGIFSGLGLLLLAISVRVKFTELTAIMVILLLFSQSTIYESLQERIFSLSTDGSVTARYKTGTDVWLSDKIYLLFGTGIGGLVSDMRTTSAWKAALFEFGVVGFVFLNVFILGVYRKTPLFFWGIFCFGSLYYNAPWLAFCLALLNEKKSIYIAKP